MAVELYSKSMSLEAIAAKLGRSPAGVYKVLKKESCPIRARKKVDAQRLEQILQFYYENGMAAPAIAELLSLSKATVLYWLKRCENPLPALTRSIAGHNLVSISSENLDLLPFVEPTHLRWADDVKIVMRIGNSRQAVATRITNAKNFFRLAGFYLAEGNKTKWRACMTNTNKNLISYYHQSVLSFILTSVQIQNIPKRGVRAAQQTIVIGGICFKKLLLNAIDSILKFLGRPTSKSKYKTSLGLSFLNGCSDGDGSVAKSKQKKTTKQMMQLRVTEGKAAYARALVGVFHSILGVGTLYRPKRRNYYEVIASLSPQRAALLLTTGFFSEHSENRRRLAMKAQDSAYLSRFVLLFSLFGAHAFSRAEMARFAPGISADFVGRSVVKGQLVPRGVTKTSKGSRIHWYRSYTLSNDTQILARRILESSGGLVLKPMAEL
ncbi:MAG: hypothetical protein KGI38_08075 [Thaumarchaeota archaeon]|nr:hypothetical protein [Nitrososphaerota archaeon]